MDESRADAHDLEALAKAALALFRERRKLSSIPLEGAAFDEARRETGVVGEMLLEEAERQLRNDVNLRAMVLNSQLHNAFQELAIAAEARGISSESYDVLRNDFQREAAQLSMRADLYDAAIQLTLRLHRLGIHENRQREGGQPDASTMPPAQSDPPRSDIQAGGASIDPVECTTPPLDERVDSKRLCVHLEGAYPIVCGVKLRPLKKKGLAVVTFLLAAGDAGITKSDLVTKSTCGDAIGILDRLARSHPLWERAISFPGDAHSGGYRVRKYEEISPI